MRPRLGCQRLGLWELLWPIRSPGRFEASNTFHGRDIYAPVAALLAAGQSPAYFGPKVMPNEFRIEEAKKTAYGI